jgi:beta-galactosidase
LNRSTHENANRLNYVEAMRRYYGALFRAGVNVDMIPPDADLSRYKLVLAPHLYVMPDAVAQRLADYVRQGGVLLADIRSGVKTETSLCHDRTLPGLLSAPLGIAIEEYEALVEGITYPVEGAGGLAGSFTAQSFVDWISPRGAETLAGYTDWHMQPFAVATRHRFGQGWGFYVGAIMKEEAFYDALTTELLAKAGVTAPLTPPAGVEVSVRSGEGRRLAFVMNHTEEIQQVKVPVGMRELLSGELTGDVLTLGRYAVAVIKLA